MGRSFIWNRCDRKFHIQFSAPDFLASGSGLWLSDNPADYDCGLLATEDGGNCGHSCVRYYCMQRLGSRNCKGCRKGRLEIDYSRRYACMRIRLSFIRVTQFRMNPYCPTPTIGSNACPLQTNRVTILLVCADEQRVNGLKDALHEVGFRTISARRVDEARTRDDRFDR